MPFIGTAFYELAGRLYQSAKESDEAELRSSISRAYYGAFLCARDAAGIVGYDGDVHARTSKHYANAGKTQLANSLDSMRVARNKADYHCGHTTSRRDAYMRIVSAQKVLMELGHACTGATIFARRI